MGSRPLLARILVTGADRMGYHPAHSKGAAYTSPDIFKRAPAVLHL